MTETSNSDMVEATAVVRAYCDAWLAGDTMAVVSLYHEDLELVWPGRNRFAGTHAGQAAAIDALLGLQAVTNRRPTEVIDVMTGASTVMATVVELWTRPDDPSVTLELIRGLEYVVVDAKLRSCRVYETDQGAIDDWLANTGETAG